ncbi:MAG: DUF3131 domain-containing protein [Cyanobacteria bacterium J06607_6]
MTFLNLRQTLSSALVGLLTASLLASCSNPTAEKQPTAENSTSDIASNAACGEFQTPLSESEQQYAAAAWQYFVNNRQPDTGFTNAANQYPSGTLWDQGNYLMALNAARWFGLIEQSEFDNQLNQLLTSLGEMPLVDGALPNKVYNSATGEMVDYSNEPTEEGIGWSALDIGRLLTAFHINRARHLPTGDKAL